MQRADCCVLYSDPLSITDQIAAAVNGMRRRLPKSIKLTDDTYFAGEAGRQEGSVGRQAGSMGRLEGSTGSPQQLSENLRHFAIALSQRCWQDIVFVSSSFVLVPRSWSSTSVYTALGDPEGSVLSKKAGFGVQLSAWKCLGTIIRLFHFVKLC